VKQGDKLRAIDDYSVCGHKTATFVSEQVDLIGIDPLLNSAKGAIAVTSDRPDEVVVEDATGKIRSAKLRTDGRRAKTRRLLGHMRSAFGMPQLVEDLIALYSHDHCCVGPDREANRVLRTTSASMWHQAFTAFVGSFDQCTLSCQGVCGYPRPRCR